MNIVYVVLIGFFVAIVIKAIIDSDKIKQFMNVGMALTKKQYGEGGEENVQKENKS